MHAFSGASECSHVHSIHPKDNPVKEHGNLYLSGVAAFREKNIKELAGINCVLSIIDGWSFKSSRVKEILSKQGI